jgi:Flp pilus assembly pilin Flp
MRLVVPLPPVLPHFLGEEDGTSLIEYVLVASLIAVVCIIALLALAKGT